MIGTSVMKGFKKTNQIKHIYRKLTLNLEVSFESQSSLRKNFEALKTFFVCICN